MHVKQLSEYFEPTNYNLNLTIKKIDRKFQGIVQISGKTAPNSQQIYLHAKQLNIKSVKTEGKDLDFTVKDDEVMISGVEPNNSYKLEVVFSGNINDAMHGLYPCYYDIDGHKKELLATQFESHHAREVFPCIDEPGAKVTFELTLGTEGDDTVLSNMPIQKQIKTDSGQRTTFEKTPKMSSYLLAWVIGDLHKKSARTARGVEVNVWATKAQPSKSFDFALDIAVETIDFFDKYFGVHYPLPKSDHVALPDFGSGAMENWGLITYREGALLAHPKETPTDVKHYIATVIAHELSHQWFGNLVTMKWWDDLWLNESFATIMEYYAVDNLRPDWNIWEEFVSSESVAALKRDALDGVQAVKTSVDHPDEIGSLFDSAIVYAKGARLIKMLISYVGEADFQKGMRAYFKKHAYGNTTSDDLWESLAESSGKDIKSLMSAWLDSPGYPLLEVNKQGEDIKLGQSRFFIGKHQKSDKIWPIPLESSCGQMPKLLDKKEFTLKRRHKTPLLFNVDSSSHYIVKYDEDLLQQITEAFIDGSLSSTIKFQILHEQELLAEAGQQSFTSLLPFIEACQQETSEIVWSAVAGSLYKIRSIIEGNEEAEGDLKQLAGKIAKSQMKRLGWKAKDNETINDTKLRPIIIGLMLYSEDKNTVQRALSEYQKGIDNIAADVRDLVLRAAIRHGNRDVFEKLINLHKKTSSSDLQSDICAAVTSTRDADNIDFLIASLKDNTLVRPQDHVRWLVMLLRNRQARDKAWEWLKSEWSWIEDKFGGDKSYDYYPRYAAVSLTSAKHLEEYKDFFSKLSKNPALKRVIEIGINELSTRIQTTQKEKPLLTKHLTKDN